ncbi:MAG: hypothetical protein Q9227_006089 [Pyrenula ochraceoflavens]
MADADEDARPLQSTADIDPSEETQDFRFLTSLSIFNNDNPNVPRRGDKDFEPNPTQTQLTALDASRQAMHDAISHPRLHVEHSRIIGQFCLDREDDRCVRINHFSGTHFRSLGSVDSRNRAWLLPEEALYLIERGSLDLRWPDAEGFEGANAIPMSLEGAYSTFIGRGGLTVERYQVYSSLKRAGYIVTRAPSWDDIDTYANGPRSGPIVNSTPSSTETTPQREGNAAAAFVRRVCRYLCTTTTVGNRKLGPMIAPGLHRSYIDIFRALALIPYHNPRTDANPNPIPKQPFRVAYHVFKPSTSYRKSAPPDPDFCLAVVDARSSSAPRLDEIGTLLDSMPYSTDAENGRGLPMLRKGLRTVYVAIVDTGVVSYMRFSDASFGRVKVYEERAQGGRKAGWKGRRGGRTARR